jgi:serine/threonine protein kinase
MLEQVIGGRYKVVAKLGEGGMGAVYEARHTETSRRVAVKVISGEASSSPSRLARFETEAKSAGQLESQYIAQVLDAGRDPATGVPFLVMEYLNGEDLSHVFARIAPLDPDLVLRIMAQACFGLEKAHAAGIVHRDIKPANLMIVERDGTERVTKILDFGIAKLLLDGQKGPTRTGSLIGSPMYMSPEQARGSGVVDHRSDIWSLGVVMYEALAGKTPFHGIEGIGDLLMTICTDEPPSVREVAPWVDEGIAQIVSSALKIDVTQRYPSAKGMLEAIKARLPMGTSIDADMLVAADQSRRPTVQGASTTSTADTARDQQQAWSAVQPRAAATGAGTQASPVDVNATSSARVPAPPMTAAASDPRGPKNEVQEGATLPSPLLASGPAVIPTMTSETESARVLAQIQQASAGYAAHPAVVSNNWYPQQHPQHPAAHISNHPPPQPHSWVPASGTPTSATAQPSKSRAVLWFGCGVAVAVFMCFVALVALVIALESEGESEPTEGTAPVPAQTSRAPAGPTGKLKK